MAEEKTQTKPLKEAKVKQKVDKIAEKHLKQLQELVNGINTIQFNIGKMEIQKHQALKDLTNVQEKVSFMQDTLMKEYGTYDVNVNDGTINWPPEKPKDNIKENPKKDEK
tara:strand:- start:414 stop:743 length:330 start_codon:yes stop_codon:yes gene_type:complete